GFPWILDNEKMYCWQRYIKLFYPHLKEIEELDPFYFYSLENLIHIMTKQNVLRAICESYITLLEHEGRLHTDFECLLCEIPINDNVSLVRGFLPVHAQCTHSRVFEFKKIKDFFEKKKMIDLDDSEVEYLWNILLQGL
ncbi:MAG: recombination protein RecO, partial [Arcobacter sp.]